MLVCTEDAKASSRPWYSVYSKNSRKENYCANQILSLYIFVCLVIYLAINVNAIDSRVKRNRNMIGLIYEV